MKKVLNLRGWFRLISVVDVVISPMNGVAVDDAVLLQNRKFHQICSNLVSKCFACSN